MIKKGAKRRHTCEETASHLHFAFIVENSENGVIDVNLEIVHVRDQREAGVIVAFGDVHGNRVVEGKEEARKACKKD